MIAVVVTLKPKVGRTEDLTALLSVARRRVLAEEHGCAFYAITRTRADQQQFKVFQVYTSQAALDEHRRTPHGRELAAQLDAVLAEPGSVEFLDIVE